MGEQRPYWQVGVRLLFSLISTVAFVIIGVKLIGFLMPFVVGWIIAAVATPVVNWLEKRLKIVKKLGSALLVVAVIALIVLGGYAVISKLTSELINLIRDFPAMYAQLESGLDQIGQTLSGVFERLPAGVQEGWDMMVDNLDQYVGELVSGISEPTMEAAGTIAKRVPYYLISAIVSVMSAYFFIVQREEVLGWMKSVTPEGIQKRMKLVMDNLKYAFGGYIKTQIKIMGVVFVILLIGLGILGTGYFGLAAFLIAFLDFLPFFGTGTVMIPWAVYELFLGDFKMAVALLVIYLISQAVRQFLQPKLLGDSVGLNPLVTLILLYVGYKFKGVMGMIFAVPIGMVLINMCQAGALDYIFDDVKILINGILRFQDPLPPSGEKKD